MEEKKKTTILAIVDDSEYGKSALRHAVTLAHIFKSSVTIVTHFTFKIRNYTQSPNVDLSNILTDDTKDLTLYYHQEVINLHHLHHLAENANGIMYVIGVARNDKKAFFNRKKALRFIKPSRLPVLTVGANPPIDPTWKNVILPIDIDRQAKEKALWAGYFNRFGGATVHLLHTIYTDAFLKQKLEENLAFIEKLYNNLEITSTLHEISPRTDNLEKYALQHTHEYNGCLLVIMTTTFKTIIDVLFGVREKSLIANKENIPVLCINEREDLYVLCT